MTDITKLDPEQLISTHLDRSRLDRYFELLMEQNRIVNLVSRETTRSDFDRMVGECLLPLESFGSKSDSYLDIGSGGGLPSIPLQLSGIGSVQTVLVERTQKKASALAKITKHLALPAKVHSVTFEELDPGRFGLVTLRYVKLTPRLLSHIMKVVKKNGLFVYYSAPGFKISAASAHTIRFHSGQDTATKSFTIFKK